MISTVYIISWFGPEKVAARRRENHKKQVDYFLGKGLKLVIFAQQYTDRDFLDHTGVEYVLSESDELLDPGAARNRLLERFYQSEEDYAIFADNDALLYDHGHVDEFFDKFINETLELEAIDLVQPHLPTRGVGYEGLRKQDPEKFDRHLVFKRGGNLKSSIFLLRNLRKHHSLEIYFSREFGRSADGGILGGEDGDFALQLVGKGLGYYECASIVLKELGGIGASTWDAEGNRTNQKREMQDKWLERHGDKGLTRTASGNVRWKDFWLENSSKPVEVLLPLDGAVNAPTEKEHSVTSELGAVATEDGDSDAGPNSASGATHDCSIISISSVDAQSPHSENAEEVPNANELVTELRKVMEELSLATGKRDELLHKAIALLYILALKATVDGDIRYKSHLETLIREGSETGKFQGDIRDKEPRTAFRFGAKACLTKGQANPDVSLTHYTNAFDWFRRNKFSQKQALAELARHGMKGCADREVEQRKLEAAPQPIEESVIDAAAENHFRNLRSLGAVEPGRFADLGDGASLALIRHDTGGSNGGEVVRQVPRLQGHVSTAIRDSFVSDGVSSSVAGPFLQLTWAVRDYLPNLSKCKVLVVITGGITTLTALNDSRTQKHTALVQVTVPQVHSGWPNEAKFMLETGKLGELAALGTTRAVMGTWQISIETENLFGKDVEFRHLVGSSEGWEFKAELLGEEHVDFEQPPCVIDGSKYKATLTDWLQISASLRSGKEHGPSANITLSDNLTIAICNEVVGEVKPATDGSSRMAKEKLTVRIADLKRILPLMTECEANAVSFGLSERFLSIEMYSGSGLLRVLLDREKLKNE